MTKFEIILTVVIILHLLFTILSTVSLNIFAKIIDTHINKNTYKQLRDKRK